jgi:TolB-like protein/Tfp pilus assembly protein PilF
MGSSLFAELKRRNVFKAGVAYLALGWVVTQVTSTVAPAMNLPGWIVPVVVWIGVIGFPFVIMFSWIYELTPEGLKRESEVDRSASITHVTGRRIDYIIIGLLVLAIGLFAIDRFVLAPRREAAHDASLRAELSAGTAASESSQPTAGSSPGASPSPASAATNVPISAQSIAVLPFVSMSEDKANEYFSDGMSEELLNLLAKIPQLHVAARTSSFSFKGKEVPIPEIAKTLLVANVLEGSVRKSGDHLRITAQLVRAADGYHLWSETYDRKLDDIFTIQDEISAKVVEQLKVTLLGATPKARTTDPQAYALYLQARELARQQKTDTFKQSDALYQQALSIDPRYAPAWAGVAENLYRETQVGMLPNQEGFARAREAAEKALAVDPDYAPAHGRLGYIALFGEHDFAGAAKHIERALALAPADVDVLRTAGVLLVSLGRLDEALALYEAVVRHDPVNVSMLHNVGLSQRRAGQLDAAIATMRTELSLSPGRGQAHYQLAMALVVKGEAAAAFTEVEQETSETWRLIGVPIVYCALGRKADADEALVALIAKEEKDAPYNIAYVFAFCGNADKAFEWLDKAIAYKDPGLGEIVPDNLFANIRSDPRWLPFLRKIGSAPEQLAKIQFKVTLPKEWQAEAATATASSGAKP